MAIFGWVCLTVITLVITFVTLFLTFAPHPFGVSWDSHVEWPVPCVFTIITVSLWYLVCVDFPFVIKVATP